VRRSPASVANRDAQRAHIGQGVERARLSVSSKAVKLKSAHLITVVAASGVESRTPEAAGEHVRISSLDQGGSNDIDGLPDGLHPSAFRATAAGVTRGW
jgi:hypothetical protein